MPAPKAARTEALSLRRAVAENRVEEFIDQEEARGIGPVERDEFDRALAETIRSPRSEDQTSCSSSRDGSPGTQTR